MVTKEQMIERMVRAFRSVDEPDLSEGLQLEYRLSAALDASGLWPVVEKAKQLQGSVVVAHGYIYCGIDNQDERERLAGMLLTEAREVHAALTAMEQTNG